MNLSNNNRPLRGFTLAEVIVTMAVVAIFGGAAFATNQRLLLSLKAQKETTAATMALQWRMENFRATAFSSIADKDYVKTNILAVRTATVTDSNGNAVTVNPFAPLGTVTELVTINQYPTPSPSPSPTASASGAITIRYDAANPSATVVTSNDALATAVTSGSVSTLQVDVLESWKSADGRDRSRQLSSIFTVGNVGQ